MSDDSIPRILLNLNSSEVRSIVLEIRRCEDLDHHSAAIASNVQRTLQKFISADSMSTPSTCLSHMFTVEEFKWLYRLTYKTLAPECLALRIYFSSKLECFAENPMQKH